MATNQDNYDDDNFSFSPISRRNITFSTETRPGDKVYRANLQGSFRATQISDDDDWSESERSCLTIWQNIFNKQVNSEQITSELQDHVKRIQIFINTLFEGGRGRVFRNDEVLNMRYEENDIRNKTWELLKILFPDGIGQINEGTEFLIINYLELLIALYKFVMQRKDKPKALSLFIKFIMIGLCFGPDRALSSIKEKDHLFFQFFWDEKDINFKKQCGIPIGEMDHARDVYYSLFRNDGFDPRVLRAMTQAQLELERQSQQKQDSPCDPEEMTEEKVKIEQQKLLDYYKNLKKTRTTAVTDDSDTEIELEKVGNPSFSSTPLKKLGLGSFKSSAGGNDAQEEKEEIKPTVPVHIAKVSKIAENPFEGKTLVNVGRVYNPNTSYREVLAANPKADVWNQTIQGLAAAGMDENAVKNVMATSAAMAHVASTLTSTYKKQNKKIYEPIPPPRETDYSIDSFNYNINGVTLEQIMGKRFCNLEFPNTTIRDMVMRGILERVISHPAASVEARLIAAHYLGIEDPFKRSKAEIQTILTDSFWASPEGDEVVPPPRLGFNDLTSECLKTLQTRIGMGPSDRFALEDLSGVQLKHLLTNLSSVISSFDLRESEAYALLARITKGTVYDSIFLVEHEHKIPFKEFWVSIQKTQKRAMSSKENEKKLQNIMNQKYVENLEKHLNDILILTDKIYQKEPDPKIRKLLCQRDTLRDIKAFIRHHYPSYASQVNTVFMERLRSTAVQKNIPSYVNENEYHAGKTYLLLEVACEVLHQCEPDSSARRDREYDEKGFHKKFARMHTVEASIDEITPEMKNSTQSPSQGRPQKQFLPKNGARNRGQQEKLPQNSTQISQMSPPNSNRQGDQKIMYNCHLCNIPGHSYRTCKRYPNETPGSKECPECHGRHTSKCIPRRPRQDNGMPGPAMIMELWNASMNHYAGNRAQGQNYRPFNPNYGSYDNRQGQNQGRRSQYRPQQPQQNGQNGQNGRRSGYKGNQGNGFRPQQPYRYDQRQIQQLEEMLKQMKQQQYNGHTNGQSTGLGNEGHQPLNNSVVLDSMSPQ